MVFFRTLRQNIHTNKPQWDNQPQIINPNFRKNNNPGKTKEVAPDQNIRPPFQEKCAEISHNNDEDEDDINIVMGIDEENTIFDLKMEGT